MRKYTKLLAVILAVFAVFAFSMTAFAAAGDPLTISVPEGDTHTYSVYQLATGDYYDGKLSNAQWGASATGTGEISSADLNTLAALAASTASDAEKLQSLAQYVDLSAPVGTVAYGSDYAATEGYYLIKDAGTLPASDTYSLYIVELAENSISVVRKAASEVPTISKVADGKDAKTAAIGDEITYTVTAQPKNLTDNYSAYTLGITDTLDAGLTLKKVDNKPDVTVKVGDAVVTEQFGITANGQVLSISKADILAITADDNGDPLTISADSVFTFTYKATLNTSATSGSAGNSNSAVLTYSNDPNLVNDGTPKTSDIPAEATVYTSTLVINSDQPGAVFELTGPDGVIPPTSTSNGYRWEGLDDGDYVVKETSTPNGFSTPKDLSITIASTIPTTGDHAGERTDLSATATQNGAPYTGTINVDVPNGIISTTLTHVAGINLPTTGSIGIIILAGAAAIATSSALGMRIKGKKENGEEEA